MIREWVAQSVSELHNEQFSLGLRSGRVFVLFCFVFLYQKDAGAHAWWTRLDSQRSTVVWRERTTFQEEEKAWKEPPTPIASIQMQIGGSVFKTMDFKSKWKTGFPAIPPPFTFSQAPSVQLDQQTEKTGFRFSSIPLPHTLTLQATGFLELWILFELTLKLEMCFESLYAGVFMSSVEDTCRWTRWLTTQHSKHSSLENPELWERGGQGYRCRRGRLP